MITAGREPLLRNLDSNFLGAAVYTAYLNEISFRHGAGPDLLDLTSYQSYAHEAAD